MGWVRKYGPNGILSFKALVYTDFDDDIFYPQKKKQASDKN